MRRTEKNARTGSVATVRAASGNKTAVPIPRPMRTTARIRSRPRRPRISPAKDGGYIRVVERASHPGEEPGEDRLLRMQAVLGLIEHHVVGARRALRGELQAPAGPPGLADV